VSVLSFPFLSPDPPGGPRTHSTTLLLLLMLMLMLLMLLLLMMLLLMLLEPRVSLAQQPLTREETRLGGDAAGDVWEEEQRPLAAT